MGKSRIRNHKDYDGEKKVRMIDSEGKTKLDKYKHLLYDEDLYEDDDFYDEFHTINIQRKPRKND